MGVGIKGQVDGDCLLATDPSLREKCIRISLKRVLTKASLELQTLIVLGHVEALRKNHELSWFKAEIGPLTSSLCFASSFSVTGNGIKCKRTLPLTSPLFFFFFPLVFEQTTMIRIYRTIHRQVGLDDLLLLSPSIKILCSRKTNGLSFST